MTATILSARLIAVTQPLPETNIPDTEALVAYCARTSSAHQDDHDTGMRLIRHCMENRHWSVFQMVNAVVEVIGPRDITRQFTRHDSMVITEHAEVIYDGFNYKAGGVQEFSQRYSDAIQFTDRNFRRQDTKNRQNSTDDLTLDVIDTCEEIVNRVRAEVESGYGLMRQMDVAKECARVILPEGLTLSRLYVNGTLRSWLHYLDTRIGNGTQLEHIEMAKLIQTAVQRAFPRIIA